MIENIESHPTMKQLIDSFFTSVTTPTTSLRERYFLRESLYSLQRLALSQHKLEMSLCVKKIISHTYSSQYVKHRKIIDYYEDHAAARNKPSSGHFSS